MDCLFVQTDGGMPPLAAGKLDAAVIYGVLCYVVEDGAAKAILGRIREALRPGAPLVMIEQVRPRRRVTEGGFKVQRTLSEWHELLGESGFSVQSTTILRHGRFPTTPLVAAGLVPTSIWDVIRKIERATGSVAGVLPWDYAEVRFVGIG